MYLRILDAEINMLQDRYCTVTSICYADSRYCLSSPVTRLGVAETRARQLRGFIREKQLGLETRQESSVDDDFKYMS